MSNWNIEGRPVGLRERLAHLTALARDLDGHSHSYWHVGAEILRERLACDARAMNRFERQRFGTPLAHLLAYLQKGDQRHLQVASARLAVAVA